MGEGDKGCNKWLTYGLGVLALVFFILTIVFGVKMGDEETVTKEVIKTVERKYSDPAWTGSHEFYDPLAPPNAATKRAANAEGDVPTPFSGGDAPVLSDAVEAIYSKLTHQQKIGQLLQYAYGDASGPVIGDATDLDAWIALAKEGRFGALLNVPYPIMNNQLQKAAVEATGIPILIGFDVVHGHRAIWPNNLGLAGTYEPELVRKLSVMSAKETRAEGIRWTFAPMLDVGRDPRKGGTMDGWGEDSYLTALYAKPFVQGFQSEKVAACAKHVAAYGIGTGGRDYTGNDVAWPLLHNEYFGGYKAAVEAGVWTAMANLATVYGIPGHAHREINTDVLRGHWGFRGMMVSDYGGTLQLYDHLYAEKDNKEEAALMSFMSGIDLDMADGIYEALRDIPEDRMFFNHTFAEWVDVAARRMVWVKEKVGLFEDNGILPYDDNSGLWGNTLMTEEAIELVTEAAEKTITLLKNEGDVLPLDPLNKENKILIVGRMANDFRGHLGSWHAAGSLGAGIPPYLTTFLTAADEICGTEMASPFDPNQKYNWCVGDPQEGTLSEKETLSEKRTLQEANCNIEYLPGYACQLNIDLAKDEPLMKEVEDAIAANDYTHIIFVGGEGEKQNGESACRAHLELPHAQSELSKRIVEAANKKEKRPKLILVPIIGRPNILTYENDNYDAILLPWCPGTKGGPAIWNVMRGLRAPSGTLAVTFPRTEGQIPIWHAAPNTGRPLPETSKGYPPYLGYSDTEERFKSRYIDEKIEPLYPFGYGLSYAKFNVDNWSISPAKVSISNDTPIDISITVSRSGDFNGPAAKTYQVYVKQLVGTPVPNSRHISGYAKVEFESASTGPQTVKTTLKPSEVFSRYDLQLNQRVEPGEYVIYIGENADDDKRFTQTITVEA